ncbi:MAG TPA: Gfo/Idh/MocA family oxidoreductase [Magnetospirillaceae bacterium]|nr:Gfo/Idh/MocA family oxidoreductase [Magnetospirillaceae bacterium]
MKPLCIGIVGTGFVAELHAQTYAKIAGPGFRVAGCCSGRPDKARAFAKRWSLPRAYGSFAELLGDPEVDAVDLCAPNDLHRDMIIAAARSGRHIICEKPLTGAFGEGRGEEAAGHLPRSELFQEALSNVLSCGRAVREAGVGFGYAENFVYAPPLVKARRLLKRAGGTILDIRAEESHSGSHAEYARRWRHAGGGSLIRLGSHPIGAVLHLKRSEGLRRDGRPIRPSQVVAETASHTRIPSFVREAEKYMKTGWVDVEDWACALITFEDGSHATVHSTDCALGGVRNSVTILASNAVLQVNINPSDTLKVYAPRAGIFEGEYIQEKLETDAGWNFPAPDEDWVRGYDAELTDFIRCFQEKREPESGLELAEDTVKVIYAAYLSSEEGRRVAVP